jgi:hypothetical protein
METQQHRAAHSLLILKGLPVNGGLGDAIGGNWGAK